MIATRKHAGFSVVEIMIGVALGLVLLISLYSLLVSNRQTYSSVQTNTELLSSGQQITQLINTLVQQAGFRNYARIKLNQLLPAETTTLAGITVAWQDRQALFVSNNVGASTSAKPNTDVLQLHFVGSRNSDSIPASVLSAMGTNAPTATAADGTIIDCLGQGVAGTSITVALYVSNDNNLICFDNINNQAVVMAPDVENLQIRVKNQLGSKEYKVADGSTNWTTISNVEVGFLLAKPYDSTVAATATSISLPGETVSIASGDNHKLRQVFVSNVMVRNYLAQ